MYTENYLYNPISYSLESYWLMTFKGINILAPSGNYMYGAIKLSSNLTQLITKNTYALFAISDYLITHRKEIRNSYKETENVKPNLYDFTPSFLISFSADENIADSVNLAKEISNFPLNIDNRIRKVLHNLELLQTGFSLNISDPSKYRNVFYCNDNERPDSILKALIASNYLKPVDNMNREYIITDEGKTLAKTILKSQSDKTAFIAMSFSAKPHEGMPDDDLAQIRNAFKIGIKKAGYEPIVIDEVKHNDYIPTKIEEQIENSSFLVIDLTYENAGAIHEAGFAEGKGIPVIRCMRRSEFDNSKTAPHFDYKQKYIILWTTYEELTQMLEEHIRKTI